jgi:hypothetical protein
VRLELRLKLERSTVLTKVFILPEPLKQSPMQHLRQTLMIYPRHVQLCTAFIAVLIALIGCAQIIPPQVSPPSAVVTAPAPNAASTLPSEAQAKTNGCPLRAFSPPDLTNKFVVQVGAFGDADEARVVCARVAAAGLNPLLSTRPMMNGGELTRLRLGPFTNRSDADRASAKAKDLGLPAVILQLH